MRYTYRCGVCRTISTHPSEATAEAERTEHARLVHHGRRPEEESITPRGPLPPVTTNLVRAWLLRHDRAVTRLAFLAIAASIGLGLLYRLASTVLG
jgi:hypothetical protein